MKDATSYDSSQFVESVVTATNRAGNAWCLDGDRMPVGDKACTVSFEDTGEREGVLRREARHV
jgi:hypothetical protein